MAFEVAVEGEISWVSGTVKVGLLLGSGCTCAFVLYCSATNTTEELLSLD